MAILGRTQLIPISTGNPGAHQPLASDFPEMVVLCKKDEDGQSVFPNRKEFYDAGKEGRMEMATEPAMTLDDHLTAFLADQTHADQKLKLMAATVISRLTDRGAFDVPGKPAVEIVVPRKAATDGNIAAVVLGEHVADRLTRLAPQIEWSVAYDVVHQAPENVTKREGARRDPSYRKGKLYMAPDSFFADDRAKYVVAVDDATRYGGSFRDLDLFAKQGGKELLAAAVFEAYETTDLRPTAQNIAKLRKAFGPEGLAQLDQSLHAVNLNVSVLTNAEVEFFAEGPIPGLEQAGSRAEAAITYLAEEAANRQEPMVLRTSDPFVQSVANGETARVSRRPALAGAKPEIADKSAPKASQRAEGGPAFGGGPVPA
ncbi:MAG: hypothetical protein KI792_10300 [Alphaproteobacteria bacterium]|nr:hypothetical protein [Alphaproteobacteria bacterium SS10]